MLIYNSTISENYLGVLRSYNKSVLRGLLSLSREVSHVGQMFAQMYSKYLEMYYLVADDLLIYLTCLVRSKVTLASVMNRPPFKARNPANVLRSRISNLLFIQVL